MCENRGLDSQGFNLNFPAVPTSGIKRELFTAAQIRASGRFRFPGFDFRVFALGISGSSFEGNKAGRREREREREGRGRFRFSKFDFPIFPLGISFIPGGLSLALRVRKRTLCSLIRDSQSTLIGYSQSRVCAFYSTLAVPY